MTARFRRANRYGYWIPDAIRDTLAIQPETIADVERDRMIAANRAITPELDELLRLNALTGALDNKGKVDTAGWLKTLFTADGFKISPQKPNGKLNKEAWQDEWQAIGDTIANRHKELTLTLEAMPFDDYQRRARAGNLDETDRHAKNRYTIERITGVAIDGANYDTFHKVKARHGLRNLADALQGKRQLADIDDRQEQHNVAVSKRRLALEQAEITAGYCRAMLDTAKVEYEDTIDGVISAFVRALRQRGFSSAESDKALRLAGSAWTARYMTHVRAPRSTTLRATYVFRRIRDWLGLPEAERQRIGTGKREYKWQLTSGRWKTLARNVARRLAITQYRKALNDTFVDTSTLCKEHLPAYLLQSVDAIAANADNLAELRLEVRAMVTTWRETRLEAIPI